MVVVIVGDQSTGFALEKRSPTPDELGVPSIALFGNMPGRGTAKQLEEDNSARPDVKCPWIIFTCKRD